jgi:hypothetical protein
MDARSLGSVHNSQARSDDLGEEADRIRNAAQPAQSAVRSAGGAGKTFENKSQGRYASPEAKA